MTWDTVKELNGINFTVYHSGFISQLGLTDLVGNRDGFVTAIYSDSTPPFSKIYRMVFTTDDGATWQMKSIVSDTPMSAYNLVETNYGFAIKAVAIPHSTSVVWVTYSGLMTEEDKYSFQRWTLGDSAREVYHLESGLWPYGAACVLYVADAGSEGGFARSTDEGSTWELVSGQSSGEIDDVDFSAATVVGYGSTVYSSAAGYQVDATQLFKTTSGGDGTLSADALAPRLSFQTETSSQTNDTLYASCDSGSLRIIYRNLRCAYTKFQSLVLNGFGPEQYSFVPTRHLNSIGLPDTTILNIHGLAIGTHDYTFHMHFVDDEFATIDTDLHFTAVVKNGASSVIAYAKSISISGYAGDTLSVPFCMIGPGNDTLNIIGPSFSTLRFTLNTDLLTPIEFQPTMPGVTATGLTVGSGNATVSLNISGSLPIHGETVIGYLRCVIRVADTTRTAVQGRGSVFTSSDSRCILLGTLEQGTDVNLLGVCGTATVYDFMRFGTLPTDIIEVRPNPATSEVTVYFRNDLHSPIHYELTNTLGNQEREGIVSTNELILPLERLPAGVYYLRANGASGGLTATRKIVVTH